MVDGVFRHLPYFSYIYANTRLICAHVSLGDRSVEDKRDTHRHRGQGVAAARFQLVWRFNLGLKTTGSRFAGFGPKKPQGRSRGSIGHHRVLASRRSDFVKDMWPFDVRNPTWTIMPLWLSGLSKVSRGSFECVIVL